MDQTSQDRLGDMHTAPGGAGQVGEAPQPHLVVGTGSGGQDLPVRAERHRIGQSALAANSGVAVIIAQGNAEATNCDDGAQRQPGHVLHGNGGPVKA
jgi:hypothetical protein